MPWLNLHCLLDAAGAEALAEALMDVGALSTSIEDADAGTPAETPQFGEPGMDSSAAWDHSRLTALFGTDKDPVIALGAACAAVNLPLPAYTLEEVEEQNWVQITQAQFDPIPISPRLWIVPSWHQAPDPEAINLILDPGMAFGTGSHPTTMSPPAAACWITAAARAFWPLLLPVWAPDRSKGWILTPRRWKPPGPMRNGTRWV